MTGFDSSYQDVNEISGGAVQWVEHHGSEEGQETLTQGCISLSRFSVVCSAAHRICTEELVENTELRTPKHPRSCVLVYVVWGAL